MFILEDLPSKIIIEDKRVYKMIGVIMRDIVNYLQESADPLTPDEFEAYLMGLSPEDQQRVRGSPENLVKTNGENINDMLDYIDDLSDGLLQLFDNLVVASLNRSCCNRHMNEAFLDMRQVIYNNQIKRLVRLDDLYEKARQHHNKSDYESTH